MRRTKRQFPSSATRGVNIRNAVVALLEDNKMTSTYLRPININSIFTTLPLDVPNRTLYVSQSNILDISPRSLGRYNVSYQELYVVNLFYYHSMVDASDINEELIVVRDNLISFFIEHSALSGLCNGGVTIKNARIKQILRNKFFYNAVGLDLVIPVFTTRNRR